MAEMIRRAYSTFEVKAVDDSRRVIRGIATTPAVDRVGDIVEPMGVKFKNPMPFLWQHMSSKPIGTVTFKKPTKDGIEFEATLPEVERPGTLKDRVDEAWDSIKLGLVRAVSIGFRAIEYAFMENGGIRFSETEVFELSAVTIPAQAEAVITYTSGKCLDAASVAVIKKFDVDGSKPGGANLNPASRAQSKSVNLRLKDATDMPTIAEQITALETKRAADAARMEAIMLKGTEEGRSSDAGEAEEFDALEAEVSTIDADLKRLRTLEKLKISTARPVPGQDGTGATAAAHRADVTVKSKEKLAPGIRFARVAKCLGINKGNVSQAFEMAKSQYAHDEDVVNVLKAAVAAGTTSNTTWAGNLISDEGGVYADFVEFLRPQTILGKFGAGGVPSLRNVPFRVPLRGQTSGGDGYWVGEGKPKPLTKFDFASTTLEPLKVANIAVATQELLRDASPSAEALIRDGLAAALRARLDTDFINPAKTASAGVSPASITNGVTPIPSSGNEAADVRADIQAVFGAFIAADNAPTSGVWIMPATTALALSMMLNPLGQPEFPGITMNGGTLFGLPVIVSEYVPTVSAGAYVVLVNANDIYLGDEGGIRIDMSTEASLQMDNAPGTQDATTGTGVAMVSLWQTNTVGFLAERTINWAKRRAEAVQVLSAVNWGQAGS